MITESCQTPDRDRVGILVGRWAVLFIWTALVLALCHAGAVAPETRHARVAEGNISHIIHHVWSQGMDGYRGILRDDAAVWGRVRPVHWLFHSVPFFLTLLRNGDLFCGDADVPLADRINGDLQTHDMFLLLCVCLALTILARLVWKWGALWWPAFLLPVLFAPGNHYLSQNLLWKFADSGEIGQILFLCMYLLCMAGMLRGSCPGRWREAIGTLCLILAYGMKETTVILLPLVLVFLAWAVWRKSSADRGFTRFAIRHAAVHLVSTGLLLLAVYKVKTGAYVGQNYQLEQGWGENLACSWGYMTEYSHVLPYLIVGGLFLAGWLLYLGIRDRDTLREAAGGMPFLLLCGGISAGLWAINVPWAQPAPKYYLPVNLFACVAGMLILGASSRLLWRRGLVAAALLWGCGSAVFLFREGPERCKASWGYYQEHYGYREVVHSVADDMAASLVEDVPVQTFHIVSGPMFEDGALPFWRVLNREYGLNMASTGMVIATVPATERNYFRRTPGAAGVEVTMTVSITNSIRAGIVYVLGPPMEDESRGLAEFGYHFTRDWMTPATALPVRRYTKP